MTDRRKGGRNPKFFASKATIGRARPGSKPLLCAVYGRGKQKTAGYVQAVGYAIHGMFHQGAVLLTGVQDIHG